MAGAAETMVGMDRKGIVGWVAGPWATALVAGLAWCAEPIIAAAEADRVVAGKREGQAGIIARPAVGFESATGDGTLSEQLIADCRDGRVDAFGFFEAALIASGVDSKDELAEWVGMYSPLRKEILASLPPGTATERLKAIHAGAHRLVLTGFYKSVESDLRTALKTGDFNCLTSLVVCSDLCRAAGLKTQTTMVSGHVFLTFELSPGRVLRVEPGTPQWAARPLGEAGGARSLTDIELLGKFFYNRGVQQSQAGKYAEGTALLQTSLQLDARDGDARANLAAGLNNWAVEHCREKRFEDAASLIEQGLSLDPHFAPLVANEQLVRGKLGK